MSLGSSEPIVNSFSLRSDHLNINCYVQDNLWNNPKNASDKMHRHYFKKETELKIQIEERSKKILEEEIQSKMEN